jgi:hypothetical protein
MFDWYLKKIRTALKPDEGPKEVRSGPAAILEDLARRVPRYLNDVDEGKLIYPACRRALSDVNGEVHCVWDHTRLEAMRYVMLVPGHDFQLLSGPARQMEMIDAYLLQRAHAETAVEFTGVASSDFAIAILAGLNWLTHCAQLAEVPPAQQSGTIRNFRKVVTLARQWWLTEGASERCEQLIANGQQPPLMLYLVWSEYTRLAKQIAAAAVFGSSIKRSAKLFALPTDLIARFETAQDPNDLLGV